MLSFIPLVVKDKDIMVAEAGIKYFLIQAVASIVVLLRPDIMLINILAKTAQIIEIESSSNS